MAYSLHNSTFQLILDPERSAWDLHLQTTGKPILQHVGMRLHYQFGRDQIRTLERWEEWQLDRSEQSETIHGRGDQLSLVINSDQAQVQCQVTFTLPEQEPALFWQLRIHNNSEQPIALAQIELLNIGFIDQYPSSYGKTSDKFIDGSTTQSRIHLPFCDSTGKKTTATDLAFFSNGWQSWSYSGVYTSTDHYQTSRLGLFRQAMIANASTPASKKAGLFSSDMFGVLGSRNKRQGILAGFLSQKNQFGSLQAGLSCSSPALRMWASGDGALLDPGQHVDTDWACLYLIDLDATDPLGGYLGAVRREHGLELSANQDSPTGWCSWYYFSHDYQGTVTPQAIRATVQAAAQFKAELPIQIIQIDDGFEQTVGDWFTFKPEFTDGLVPLSGEIRQAGLTPGLWLAPFIVHPKSRIYREHPDWILRTAKHRPVNAGFCWNAFTTGLDLTHPEAMDYCRQVIHKAVHEWGYRYLKLDFLYAAALPGKHHDPHKTRAEVLRAGLETIRETAGEETILLGCGCPLGPAIGLVDAMRIGTDTAKSWYPSFMGTRKFFDQDTSMPSAAYALHNALTRAPLHHRWWINDPDCLLVRADSHLSLEEIQSVASVIALTGGSLFLSDDLPLVTEERLRIAKNLLPLIGKRPNILDWFDQSTPSLLHLDLEGAGGQWRLISVFNWSNHPVQRSLDLSRTQLNPGETYLAREFWSGQRFTLEHGRLPSINIPVHGVRLLGVRVVKPELPIYLGSDLHISQGLELAEWSVHEGGLSLRVDRPGQAEGVVDLYLPAAIKQVDCDSPVDWKELDNQTYRLYLKFFQSIRINISY